MKAPFVTKLRKELFPTDSKHEGRKRLAKHLFGISPRTVEGWELGRPIPAWAARSLRNIKIGKMP